MQCARLRKAVHQASNTGSRYTTRKGKRIYGIENAHKAARRSEFDHRHPYRSARLVAYEYRSPAGRLERLPPGSRANPDRTRRPMKKHMRKPGTFKTGSFQEFKEFTLAVVRGKRKVDPREPKIWVESAPGQRATQVQFQSLEAAAKLLSPKNRALLRMIADRQPKSVSELATLAHRAEQNLLRTLHKLSEACLIRLDKGAGRAYQPV